jgi:hypothetical protein
LPFVVTEAAPAGVINIPLTVAPPPELLPDVIASLTVRRVISLLLAVIAKVPLAGVIVMPFVVLTFPLVLESVLQYEVRFLMILLVTVELPELTIWMPFMACLATLVPLVPTTILFATALPIVFDETVKLLDPDV